MTVNFLTFWCYEAALDSSCGLPAPSPKPFFKDLYFFHWRMVLETNLSMLLVTGVLLPRGPRS